MPETRCNGLRISYDDLGQGEVAVLLMPGWCVNRTLFSRLAGQSSRHRRTLALDWRGHGKSESPSHDFGNNDLVEDALSVIKASGAQRIVPVAQAHSGWIAIELRRQLGERIPKLVLLDWIVLQPPQPFLDMLKALQTPDEWKQAREHLLDVWVHGVRNTEVIRFVSEEIGAYGFEMWARAAREISGAYSLHGSPLQELTSLHQVPVLHLYSQPDDPGYLAAQQSFATNNPWFKVRKMEAHSHFPALEVPDEIETEIDRFVH